jgi:hypothetical protein
MNKKIGDRRVAELFKQAKKDGILKDNGCLAKTDRIIQIEKERGIDCNDDMLGTLIKYYE